MLAIWSLCTAALAAAVSADVVHYDPLMDDALGPEFREGLRQYRSHRRNNFRRHRPHKMALAHHVHSISSFDAARSEALAEAEAEALAYAEDEATPAPNVDALTLPGRHPSVEKALDGMSGDLQTLKEKQVAAKEARGQLEGSVSQVTHHMNDAMSLKHAMAQKEAALREEKRKLQGLEYESHHVAETHSSLVASLHRVLEPKLIMAQERLQKKEMFLAREEAAVKGWQGKKEQLHAHAIELLKEKKALHQSFLESERVVAEAKRKYEESKHKYEDERRMTGREIQSFRYAETRAQAEITHEKAAEESRVAAEESVKKLRSILSVESEKVDESMEVNKNRIRQRMQQVEAAREKTANELMAIQHKYHEWQEVQRHRAADVVKKAMDTEATSEAYAENQKRILEAAKDKVVQGAMPKKDWAWEGSNAGFEGFSDGSTEGFTDSNPSFND